ncbi:MAG: Crp/Fnr family transcriptional regulator [Alphaproteobacteria bacterium]
MAIGLCFDAGDVVFEQGDELDRLFVITEGMVRLSHLTIDGNRQITGFLGPGDLMGSIKRSADAYCTAEAMTRLVLCSFERPRFSDFLQHHPDLCLKLFAVATDEIEAQYDHGILLSRKHAAERVAVFLHALSQRAGQVNGESPIIDIPMSRSDIADHLGLTIETVSRVLTRFKQQGMIEFRGPKTVVVKNMAALDELAGFENRPKPRMAIGL